MLAAALALAVVAVPRAARAHPPRPGMPDHHVPVASEGVGTAVEEAEPDVDADPDAALFARIREAEAASIVAASRTREDEPAEYMRADGVDDPFPDREPTTRRRHAAVLLGVGFGVAAAATITARLTLLPRCDDERDAMTCEIPDRGDIGARTGRLIATAAFATGGAVFGALGGRELGQHLSRTSADPRRQRIAVGLGATATAVGAIGIIAGAAVLGVGVARSVRLADSFGATADTTDPVVVARIDETIDQVRTARVGLMLLAASPTLLATGASLLAHRPRGDRVRVGAMVSRSQLAVAVRVRF